ncbi:MAG: hypothetical protein M1833_000301 [Piccolia ochrophora]|nr:MAG: hypothetical protein M1833_000301 [Piccolia ochrophora]
MATAVPISPIVPNHSSNTNTANSSSSPSTTTDPQQTPPAVELDGSPITPTANTAASAHQLKGGRREPPRRSSSAEPGKDIVEYEELSGEVGAGRLRAEEREKMRAEKSLDPAVLVNIPQTPDAQDYEVVSGQDGDDGGGTGGGVALTNAPRSSSPTGLAERGD